MKITQRILSALLIMVMVCAYIPMSAAATDSVTEIKGNVTNGAPSDIQGFPYNATDISYLSDAKTEKNTGYDGTLKLVALTAAPTLDVPFSNCYKFSSPDADATDAGKATIYLGGYGTAYAKGLGANAGNTNADWKLIYTNNDSQYFYAVAGNNGANSTKNTGGVTFQVYGATASGHSAAVTYTKLAEATVTGCQVAEFLVDISGYKLVWLNTIYNGTAGSGRYGAWGNASFLKVGEEPKTNVAFESALSVVTGWNTASFTKTPAKVYYTYKNETTSTTVNTQFEGFYAGVLEGVAAKEMSEKVSMYLADASGNPVTGTISNSIRDYAIKYLTSGSLPEYKAVAGSMLDYGAAVQNYFQYNTENPANADAPAYEGLNYEDFIGEIKDVRQGSDKFYATNLRLEDEINLMFYFQDLPENCTVSFDWNGVETVIGTLVATNMDGVMMAELTELPIGDYRETVTCTVKDAEGNVVATGQDSVASYALRALSKSDKRAKVCEELLEYAESVTRYLRTKHNYTAVVTNPSCTTDGYTTYTCQDANCCESYVGDYVPATWHKMNGSDVCSVCNQTPVPAFNGGVSAGASYNAGQNNYLLAYNSVNSVSVAKTYETALVSMGYTLVQENEVGSNRFATYTRGEIMVHCTYFGSEKEFRITYGPKTYMGATEAITEYSKVVTPSVSMLEIADTGLTMVVQLADGSFIVIDGGIGQDSTTDQQAADLARLVSFLKEKTPNGGKPQITWMITHAHSDHIIIASRLLANHTDEVDVNLVCYNFPVYSDLATNANTFVNRVKQYFPNAEHYVMHTGNKLYLPGCEIEFLFTASEDLYPTAISEGNDTSNVWRITVEGKSILITGDIQDNSSAKIARIYGNYLASNILQVVHHGIDGATQEFNNCVASGTAANGNNLEVCFWSIRSDKEWRTQLYNYNKVLRNTASAHYNLNQTTTILLPSLTKA